MSIFKLDSTNLSCIFVCLGNNRHQSPFPAARAGHYMPRILCITDTKTYIGLYYALNYMYFFFQLYSYQSYNYSSVAFLFAQLQVSVQFTFPIERQCHANMDSRSEFRIIFYKKLIILQLQNHSFFIFLLITF